MSQPQPLPNLRVKSPPRWDWSGSVPNLQLHNAWCNKWSQGAQVKFHFSEKYVTKCLNSAIMNIEVTELSMQAKMVRNVSKNSGILPILVPLIA